MLTANPASQITGLLYQLQDAEIRIDIALAGNNRRAFKLWCQRRSRLARRLQELLVIVATT